MGDLSPPTGGASRSGLLGCALLSWRCFWSLLHLGHFLFGQRPAIPEFRRSLKRRHRCHVVDAAEIGMSVGRAGESLFRGGRSFSGQLWNGHDSRGHQKTHRLSTGDEPFLHAGNSARTARDSGSLRMGPAKAGHHDCTMDTAPASYRKLSLQRHEEHEEERFCFSSVASRPARPADRQIGLDADFWWIPPRPLRPPRLVTCAVVADQQRDGASARKTSAADIEPIVPWFQPCAGEHVTECEGMRRPRSRTAACRRTPHDRRNSMTVG